MLASYTSALAPGTQANRKKQAEEYVRFSLIYRFHHLQPTVTNVCMYAQFLANKHAAPTSVRNYLSGAKTWVVEHQVYHQLFLAPQLASLVKGFVKNSTHVPARAEPLLPHHIRLLCQALDRTPSAPLAIKPAVLIGYSCFLRASNLLSPTMLEWGGPHTLLAGDVKLTDAGILVHIRSTKTRSDPLGLKFLIPPSQSPAVCPVRAWAIYRQAVRPWALGPAFLHQNKRPITSGQVVKIMRLLLKNQQDISAGKISMHSLRRGATHAAIEQDIPLQDILDRGTWKSSSGIKPYLPVQSRSVPTITVSNLA